MIRNYYDDIQIIIYISLEPHKISTSKTWGLKIVLSSNGRVSKQVNNYHMSLQEFKLFLEYIQAHYSMGYVVLTLCHALLGLRASEVCAINVLDFSNGFRRLTYRSAKTNQILYHQPVPDELAELIKTYVNLEGYRMKHGFLFSYYSKPSCVSMSKKCYEVWFWRARQEIAKIHPQFNDHYIFEKDGHTIVRYRINTHSLRRLHRTILMAKVNDVYLVQKLCHYQKIEVLQRYLNIQSIEEKRNEIINNVFNPIMKDMFDGNSKQMRMGFYG